MLFDAGMMFSGTDVCPVLPVVLLFSRLAGSKTSTTDLV